MYIYIYICQFFVCEELIPTADQLQLELCKSLPQATQQTCLLCDTADMSVVGHSRNVCCVTWQTCLLRNIADMSAV